MANVTHTCLVEFYEELSSTKNDVGCPHVNLKRGELVTLSTNENSRILQQDPWHDRIYVDLR